MNHESVVARKDAPTGTVKIPVPNTKEKEKYEASKARKITTT